MITEDEVIDFARSIAPRIWQFIEYSDLKSIIFRPGCKI